REMARIAAGAFDYVILRRDDELRGRGPEDVPRIMAAELAAVGYPSAQTKIVPDEQEAIDFGLRQARRGDLLLIFGDKISRDGTQAISRRGAPAPGPEPAPPPPVVEAPRYERTALIQDERGVRLARETED